MMTDKREVWKFPIVYQDTQVLSLPRGAKILHFDAQGIGELSERLWIWAEVNPDLKEYEDRCFAVVGTGHAFMDTPGYTLAHVGSVLTEGGRFVWHLYEATPDQRQGE